MCSFKSVSCMSSTAGINSLYHVEQFRQFTLTKHCLLTVSTYNKHSILEINIILCMLDYFSLCPGIVLHRTMLWGNDYISSSGFLIKLAVGR